MGKYCSKKCSNKANAGKLSISRKGKNNPRFGKEPWNKGKRYSLLDRQGSNSHAWKGGRSREKYFLRRRSAWKVWREEVFKRDGYKCRITGLKGELVPHHIKLFAFFPEDRFKVENGITLLDIVHKKLHKESYKNIPYCFNCIKKIKMEPIIVNLDMAVYRCHICKVEKTLKIGGGVYANGS